MSTLSQVLANPTVKPYQWKTRTFDKKNRITQLVNQIRGKTLATQTKGLVRYFRMWASREAKISLVHYTQLKLNACQPTVIGWLFFETRVQIYKHVMQIDRSFHYLQLYKNLYAKENLNVIMKAPSGLWKSNLSVETSTR